MIEIRHIEEKDQQQLAHVIRSVFEEYGAPLVNTVYDDPRTEHIFDAMAGKNAGYFVVADDGVVQGRLRLLSHGGIAGWICRTGKVLPVSFSSWSRQWICFVLAGH